jgi:hypothetical protein
MNDIDVFNLEKILKVYYYFFTLTKLMKFSKNNKGKRRGNKRGHKMYKPRGG